MGFGNGFTADSVDEEDEYNELEKIRAVKRATQPQPKETELPYCPDRFIPFKEMTVPYQCTRQPGHEGYHKATDPRGIPLRTWDDNHNSIGDVTW